jgi:hypothetical protein
MTTKHLIPVAAAVLAALSLAPAASAQGDCKEAKGNLVDVFSGGSTTSGTITNAGWLDGTTLTVYSPAFVITPNPNVVSYTATMTLTTGRGQLKISNTYLYNFVTGQGTVLGSIDGAGSTGDFAGATGVIFLNTTATTGTGPVNYLSTVAGQVCFAK